MKLFLLCLLIPILTFSQLRGKVINVKDGDTVVVLDSYKEQHIVRVADIDCPEYKQLYSNLAKNFTSDQVFSKEVFIEIRGKDRYGRTIGLVFYDDNKNLSRELLKKGLAWHYVRYSESPNFSNFEAVARATKIGLWQDNNPVPPWDWRRKKH